MSDTTPSPPTGPSDPTLTSQAAGPRDAARRRWWRPRRGRGWFGKRLIRRNWLRRLTLGLVVVVVAATAVGVSAFEYANYQYHQMTFIPVPHLVKVQTTGPHANAVNILLIGSTSRCVLNGKQAGAFGSCADGVTGVNSDVMMLLHADPNTGRVSILSLPRDLILENVRPGQFHKLDAALADGPDSLVQTVEQDFGIPINHFVELNFDSFQSVVNAIGGVYMDFPDPVSDQIAGLSIPTAGCHYLDGFQALAVVRARHMSYYVGGQEDYDGSGDLGRIIRDHEFLRVLATQVAEKGLLDPVRDVSLLDAIMPQLTVDTTFSLSDLVDLIGEFHATNPNKALETTLPNIEDSQDYMYQDYDYGSVVLPSYPQDQQAIDQWLGVSGPAGGSIPPSSISVNVEDGINDPAGVNTTVSQLQALGYHAAGTGQDSVDPVGPLAETLVYYSAGHLGQAERVTESLSGIVSMAEGPTIDHAEVTIVTGTNYAVSKPASSSTTTTGPSSSSSTTTSTTLPGSSNPASSYLDPVSSAVQALPSYDPRACSDKQIAALGQ
jgi:LCP family protein required for cell wall assembly